MEYLFKKELETIENLAIDFISKRDKLMIRNALYAEFRALLNLTYEPGVTMSLISQYITEKIDEL